MYDEAEAAGMKIMRATFKSAAVWEREARRARRAEGRVGHAFGLEGRGWSRA